VEKRSGETNGMKLTESYFKESKESSWITKVFWWLSGADPKILRHSPYSDHVKYFGLGGIVLATGVLAALSGGYAFYTVFSPGNFDGMDAGSVDGYALFQASFFALIWGLIILNLDRFIISSSGIGDGSGNISKRTLLQASPRIFMAIVLSIVIAAPLELRIFEPEIEAELFKIQKEELLVLNQITDTEYAQRLDEVAVRRSDLEESISELEGLVKEQEIKYQEEIAGRVSGIPGAGRAAKSIRVYLDEVIIPNLAQVRSQNEPIIANLWSQTDSLKVEKTEAYTVNKTQVQKMGGLLQRLTIAHEIAGWKLSWLIRLIFIVIETAPILFKMMMRNEVYEALHENLKNHILRVELNEKREID
jgi:hypothetical protein